MVVFPKEKYGKVGVNNFLERRRYILILL